ncbi:hypothetical protein Tco_0798583 [Tanacetum coccineum]
MRKVLQERGSGSLPRSTETNPIDHVKWISTTVETDTPLIRRVDPIRYAVSNPQNRMQFFKPSLSIIPFPNRLIDDSYDEMEGLNELMDREKSATNLKNNIIRRVYALELREIMELDLEARLTGEALILNRSLDHVYGDYIELSDLNELLELRRNQVEDLGPTIKDGEIIDEPMENIVNTRNGFEHVNVNFFPILSINVMSRKFYNFIMKVKVEYKGKNVVGAFINVPIFVENFSIVTDFAVVENMDTYRDRYMGEVIVGKPFCRASCVEARRFDGMITIYNSNDSVTYQMARSYPRFKHLTNEQCNKMRPLLKVSAQDELNGI